MKKERLQVTTNNFYEIFFFNIRNIFKSILIGSASPFYNHLVYLTNFIQIDKTASLKLQMTKKHSCFFICFEHHRHYSGFHHLGTSLYDMACCHTDTVPVNDDLIEEELEALFKDNSFLIDV